jgi:hypothetical protein
MSIGIGFDDDYSAALTEYKSRNGMSVKEMYGALNNHDRLVECLKKEREKYDVFFSRLSPAYDVFTYGIIYNYENENIFPDEGIQTTEYSETPKYDENKLWLEIIRDGS